MCLVIEGNHSRDIIYLVYFGQGVVLKMEGKYEKNLHLRGPKEAVCPAP